MVGVDEIAKLPGGELEQGGIPTESVQGFRHHFPSTTAEYTPIVPRRGCDNCLWWPRCNSRRRRPFLEGHRTLSSYPFFSLKAYAPNSLLAGASTMGRHNFSPIQDEYLTNAGKRLVPNSWTGKDSCLIIASNLVRGIHRNA